MLFASGSFAQQADMSLIPYRQGDKWGYATADKKVVIAPKYNEANWFSEGLASVKVGTKYGYIDKEGKLVIPAKFTVAKSFRKGYVPDAKKAGGDSDGFKLPEPAVTKMKKTVTIPQHSNWHRDRTGSSRLPYRLWSSPDPFAAARHPG